MFSLTDQIIDTARLMQALDEPSAGACVVFEGRVRNHHNGRAVTGLEYEAYAPLAQSEGQRILEEACERFGIQRAIAQHRLGTLDIGENAVWVGVATAHRKEAFTACAYIIDQLKARVPIWKKEFYTEGPAEWVKCHGCHAAASALAEKDQP